MKRSLFPTPLKFIAQYLLILALVCLASGSGRASAKSADTPSNPQSCGQLLAEAEAKFLSTLAPDGSVPATPETEAAAQEYIRVSKVCYEELETLNPVAALQEEQPTFIDEGGVLLGNESSAEFVLAGNKWGSASFGTNGGTVTYSFMGNGLSLSSEPNSSAFGNSVAVSSLSGFQACFITEIQTAFAAWQAVSNIQFVQVTDSGSAFNAPGAGGDIRIGAHTFDGPSGTLAHAYFPPPNGNSAAGDMHFDRAESWTCNTTGIDIGVVAMHEIGHSLGLGHEDTQATTAVMDPFYNPSLTSLQSDDVNGAVTIYGAAELVDPPTNDNFAGAKPVSGVPSTDTIDTTGAAETSDGPLGSVSCDGNNLRKGTKNVWYTFTSPTNRFVSFDTEGSNYDTYIAVWTGANVNSLTLLGCDDDTTASLQSQISLNAQANVTYRIEVAQYNGTANGSPSTPTGGSLHFNATTFEDVAGNYWAWRWIEGFYDQGITVGCVSSPVLRYCPEREVTRAEMAVFLLRAKYGESHQPNPVQTGIFADVPVTGKEWMQPWIEEFYEEGITIGCAESPLRYCPERSVTRAEMAVFILKAKYGAGYQPNPAQTGIFADVPVTFKEWMQPWIEEFYEQGITTGCAAAPLRYCPERPVTRAEMAVFIDRAFGIPLLP